MMPHLEKEFASLSLIAGNISLKLTFSIADCECEQNATQVPKIEEPTARETTLRLQFTFRCGNNPQPFVKSENHRLERPSSEMPLQNK